MMKETTEACVTGVGIHGYIIKTSVIIREASVFLKKQPGSYTIFTYEKQYVFLSSVQIQ